MSAPPQQAGGPQEEAALTVGGEGKARLSCTARHGGSSWDTAVGAAGRLHSSDSALPGPGRSERPQPGRPEGPRSRQRASWDWPRQQETGAAEGTSELAVSQDGYSRCARVKPSVGVWLQRAGLSRYRTGLHSLEVTARRGGGFTAPEANKAVGGARAGPTPAAECQGGLCRCHQGEGDDPWLG